MELSVTPSDPPSRMSAHQSIEAPPVTIAASPSIFMSSILIDEFDGDLQTSGGRRRQLSISA